MTDTEQFAFLGRLGARSLLHGSAFRQPIAGPKAMARVVEALAMSHRSWTALFDERKDSRRVFAYEGTLTTGQEIHGLVLISEFEDGAVAEMHFTHSPLGSVLALSRLLEAELGAPLGAGLFFGDGAAARDIPAMRDP